jgi:hypothetical protein
MSLIITSLVVALVAAAVQWFVERSQSVGGQISYDVDSCFHPSEQDQQLIEDSKELVQSHFGGKIAETLLPLTPQQRSEKVLGFTQELIELYGLEIERLSVEDMPNGTKGGYSVTENAIYLNGKYFALDDPEELKDIVDTIIHECRHARQHRMIDHPDEFHGDPAELERWRKNFAPGNYIRPEYDPRGYFDQSVEFDARNFASSVIGQF